MDPQDLTSEDWYIALEGMRAATGLIITADLSGPVGMLKEVHAELDVMREGQWQTPFIALLCAQALAPTQERRQDFDVIAQARNQAMRDQEPTTEEMQQNTLAAIRNAVALVEAQAGEEAAAEYRQLVYAVAEHTAAASKEGGFLGFGGKPVSEAEQAALALIKDALGL